MTNRTQKQLKDFKELINKDWQLNIQETDFLDTILNLILERNTEKVEKIVDNYLDEDWDEILEIIPDSDIQWYAEEELRMVKEDYIQEKTVSDFDNDELLEELNDRGYAATYNYGTGSNIVTDLNFAEMSELFLSFSAQKQQDIINFLK